MHLDTYALGTPQELEQVAGWWTARLRKPGAQGWREQRWTPGTAHRFPADHLHEVWNESGRDAWSLHVYAPRLVTMRFYGAGSNDRLAPLRSETASNWL